jgi:lysophospholipase L1-like esterase
VIRLLACSGTLLLACSAVRTADVDGGGVHADGGDRRDAGGPDGDVGPDGGLADLHLIGRFDRSLLDAPRFAWSGSAIWARFEGTELAVDLEDSGMNQFDVVIDGGTAELLTLLEGPARYTLASGLAEGTHDVRLVRRTEARLGPTTFRGFVGAQLVPSAPPERWIEIVGDSITCGYGVLGDGPNCPFSPDTEAETHAYGALAASEVGAAHTAIAYSGRGVVRNYAGEASDLMPALWTRTIADDPESAWDFSLPEPTVVVVNLGTNDFSIGDPGPTFVDGYDAFLQDIRARYPDTWIFVATSPMLSDSSPEGEMRRTRHRMYLDAVIAGAASRDDARVSLLEFAEQDPADGFGCNYHPNETTNATMATVLVDAIRDVASW